MARIVLNAARKSISPSQMVLTPGSSSPLRPQETAEPGDLIRNHITCKTEIFLLLLKHDTFNYNILTFPCTQCGLCCQHVDRSVETSWLDRGDGSCRHFDAINNACKVYDIRPLICRVDEMYPRFSNSMTRTAYYEANSEVCNALQVEHSYPKQYRIYLREN
jgi:Fe-S-cluster containining protein